MFSATGDRLSGRPALTGPPLTNVLRPAACRLPGEQKS